MSPMSDKAPVSPSWPSCLPPSPTLGQFVSVGPPLFPRAPYPPIASQPALMVNGPSLFTQATRPKSDQFMIPKDPRAIVPVQNAAVILDAQAEHPPIQQERKGTNVYVSNLPASMTASRFRSIFSPFGTIIGARLVKRRKGDAPVGFVQYIQSDMAHAAIAGMDGRQIEGAKLSVRLANRDKDKGINNKPSSNLYVANLPQKVTELDLRVIFSRYGEIHSLRVLKYPNTGVSKGTALVRFVSIEDASRAKEALHCLPLHGQDLPLEVKYAETKEEKLSRRDDRGNEKAKSKTSSKDSTGTPASGQLEDCWDDFDKYDEDEQDAAEDLLGSGIMSATMMMDVPLHSVTSPKLSPEQSEDAMHALSDYMKFMMGSRVDTDMSENISWISQSSSNVSSSMGHTESIGAIDSPDQSSTPKTNENFRLNAGAQPFVPKIPGRDLCFGIQEELSISDSIMAEGLPPQMDKLALYEVFGPLGAILKLESVLDADSCTRTAIIKFRTPDEAIFAQSKLNGVHFKGHLLRVKMF